MASRELTLVDYHNNCSSVLLARQDRMKQEKSITFYKLSVAGRLVNLKQLWTGLITNLSFILFLFGLIAFVVAASLINFIVGWVVAGIALIVLAYVIS